eukprot:m.251234 g.251234  ORF g.251234 m.251234 type:complete len:67 (+) comp15448_c0_seq4:2936-3136(+)
MRVQTSLANTDVKSICDSRTDSLAARAAAVRSACLARSTPERGAERSCVTVLLAVLGWTVEVVGCC